MLKDIVTRQVVRHFPACAEKLRLQLVRHREYVIQWRATSHASQHHLGRSPETTLADFGSDLPRCLKDSLPFGAVDGLHSVKPCPVAAH